MKVYLVMGSDSDWPVMKNAKGILDKFGIECVCKILSAHRTPHLLSEFMNDIENISNTIVVAGAGGAAHLPGMLASFGTTPVIGVPIKSSNLQGMDSLLSIVQMPKGVPVSTMAINGAENAALFALEIFSVSGPMIKKKLQEYKKEIAAISIEKNSIFS